MVVSRDRLDRIGEMNRFLHEKHREPRAQYVQEPADLQYVRSRLQVRLANYDSRSEESWESLNFARKRLEELRLESELCSGILVFFPGVIKYVNETFRVHLTCTDELASSSSDALELESPEIIEVLHSTKRSGTVCSANLDPQARSPDLPL